MTGGKLKENIGILTLKSDLSYEGCNLKFSCCWSNMKRKYVQKVRINTISENTTFFEL